MKTRDGFVSNSSSSSFFVVGIEASTREDLKPYAKSVENGYMEFPNGMIQPNGTNILGFGGLFDEYDIETYELSEITELEKEARELFGESARIQLFVGMGNN